MPAHGNSVIGRKNIQKLFASLLLEAENYKKITEKLLRINPDLEGIPLVKKLAEKGVKETALEWRQEPA